MAFVDAYMILEYIKSYEGKELTSEQGMKALVHGIMLGSAGYLSGIAVGLRSSTIL